jgi:predicted acetyltransferase
MTGREAPAPHAALALVEPTAALQASYRGLVAEFLARGEPLVPFTLGFPHEDFGALLARLDDCARGIGIPEGFVAHSTYWLVRDGAEIVGVSNLRHALTWKLRREGGNVGYGVRPSARGLGYSVALLAATLPRARAVGLARVLVTCSRDNVRSARAIARNGGVLDSEEFIPERGEVVQRWWITTPPAGTGARDLPPVDAT